MRDDSCEPGATVSDNAFGPLAWFNGMIGHCQDFAQAAKKRGQPVVGIFCEFAPREIILAAGAVPVCLCGGSPATIGAAEGHLPANLCPLIKSTYGGHLTGQDPFLECADLLVAETTCDGKKKMFELLGKSRPMYLLELPQKSEDPDAFVHWNREVRKLKEHLERRFHLCITGNGLRHTIGLMNRERSLRRRLADLMIAELPPLTGRQLIEFRSIISGVEADLEQYTKALELFDQGFAAPGSPRATGVSPVRVLVTGVPLVPGTEWVLDLIEKRGAVVVCMENCTGLKPILEDVSPDDPDPLLAIARKSFHVPCSVMTSNWRRLESLRALAAKFRPQCVIELVWHTCLTYDIESFQVRKMAEEELRLPYLKITSDGRSSDAPGIAESVDALMDTIQSRGPAGAH